MSDTQDLRPKALFPTDLPARRFAEFAANAFECPVTGVIFDSANPPVSGMPLGGLGTGCLDLEASGLLGFCTLFNSLVPRRGPVNLPFLGVAVGDDAWVLADPAQAADGKSCTPGFWGYGCPPHELGPQGYTLDGVRLPRRIRYWGHYPIADMEFELDGPIAVGLRAWSPFLPGDVETSMLPGAVFEVHLRNRSDRERTGTLAFSFPGPNSVEASEGRFVRRDAQGVFTGVEVASEGVAYALGVAGPGPVRHGGGLGIDGPAWAALGRELPAADAQEPGTSLAVDFSLDANAATLIHFVLTWCAPEWNAWGGNRLATTAKASYAQNNWPTQAHTFMHRYAVRWPDALATGRHLCSDHGSILRRVIGWQQEVYSDPELPGWLKDSLINNLHLIPECGVWAEARPPIGEWCRKEDGLFGMNECPRGCPQMECFGCSFYGNLPLVYFFPEAALSTLRGYKALQHESGATPWIFGYVMDVAGHNHKRMQTMNGLCYAAMVDRYRMCWGDEAFSREFYDSVKRNMEYVLCIGRQAGRTPGEVVASMPGRNPSGISEDVLSDHWFEAPEPGWFGLAPHVAGLHMAQLRIVERMAEEVGDYAYAEKCRRHIAAGAAVMEEKTWRGDCYLTCLDGESGRILDNVFAYQLDGQWVADAHGVPPVFDRGRARITLDTIRSCNVALSKTGATNYANRDGTPAEVKGYGPYAYFPPELLMLAMTCIYAGDRGFGIELARRCWENIVCAQGYGWDMPNIISGQVDDSVRQFGADYYQDMMLWALPAAIAGTGIAGPCKPGGLVARMIEAGREDQS